MERKDVIGKCREIYSQKYKDYGTSWRVLRVPSITDQIYIKAERIRVIQEKKVSKVNEGIESELYGIINYSIIALIQIELLSKGELSINLNEERVLLLFETIVKRIEDLYTQKNHDYGDVWREMRVSSFVDFILVRIRRIKQIEDNEGNTLVSEGVESNYMDIANYAIFALLLNENPLV